MKNSLLIVLFFVILSSILNLIYKITLTNMLLMIFLCVAIYLFVNESTKKQKDRHFIEENLMVARGMLLDSSRFLMIIVRDKKIIWCNEQTYTEFPILLSNRSIKDINLHEITNENKFKYNNKIYHVDVKSGLYIIENVTAEERFVKNLIENKPNMAIIKIDNYDFTRNSTTDSEFLKFEQSIRSNLLTYFEENKIYHIQLSVDTYQVMMPTSLLDHLIETKFKEILDLAIIDGGLKTAITFSIGVSLNYKNTFETGDACEEAIELATNRGGAQIVIFDNGERSFYGGNVDVVKGTTKMKARVMSNTLVKLISSNDVAYILTHKFPDSDALSALILMKIFINSKIPDITVKVVLDSKMEPNLKLQFEKIGLDYIYDFVLDKTKKNIFVVVDTQSSDFISHPSIVTPTAKIVLVDHHQTPINYIEKTMFNWIEPTLSSTTEMLLETLDINNIYIKNELVANFSLLGILTDTNNLTYRTKTSTIEMIGVLLAAGATFAQAKSMMYVDYKSFLNINTLISNVYLMNDVAVLRTTQENNDFILSMCANSILEIQGVNISIVVNEMKDNVNKVKIRTTDKYNAKLIIEKYGGGGHARQAAGIFNDEKVFALLNDLKEK